MMNDLSAKVFRTYNASRTLQEQLSKEEIKTDNIDEKVKFYEEANRQVAILCNHQKAVPKNFEEKLNSAKEKLEEKKQKIDELQQHLKLLKKGKDGKKDLPKTEEAT